MKAVHLLNNYPTINLYLPSLRGCKLVLGQNVYVCVFAGWTNKEKGCEAAIGVQRGRKGGLWGYFGIVLLLNHQTKEIPWWPYWIYLVYIIIYTL